MSNTRIAFGGAVMLAAIAASPALGQVLDQVRGQQAAQQPAQQDARSVLRATQITDPIRDVSARDAVEFVSEFAGVPILINWDQIAQTAFVDPGESVRVPANVTAEDALEMILEQASPEDPLISEASGNFVRVMTKDQANQRTVVGVYEIGDLLLVPPDFLGAPQFDLSQITQGQSTGGGGGGGGQQSNLFGGGQGGGQGQGGQGNFIEGGTFRWEQAERIATLIRETIEPDIWQVHGGLYGAITFFGDALVIRAPRYVHRQIDGGVAIGEGPTAATPAPRRPGVTPGMTPAAGIDGNQRFREANSYRFRGGNTAGIRRPLQSERR